MIGFTEVRELVSLAGRGWNRLAHRLRADHRTILTGRLPGSGLFVGGFYAVVAVAPSRQIRPMTPSDLTEAATAWVRAAWPGVLDGTVYISVPDLVRFEARGDDGEIDVAVEVRPTGLVETLTRVPSHEREDGTHLELVDVLRPVVTLGRAIELPHLDRLWHRRRRLDWHVNLSSQQARREGSTNWAGLILPGSTTPRRASNAYPVTPQRGFATAALTGRSRRKPLLELMTLVAQDLLVHSGYHTFGDAPVEAARQAFTPIASSSSRLPREPTGEATSSS